MEFKLFSHKRDTVAAFAVFTMILDKAARLRDTISYGNSQLSNIRSDSSRSHFIACDVVI